MTRVKNWAKFQHFKDRKPPWIKLYRDILDDVNWHKLEPKAAKALVSFWLIASEFEGELPDIETLAFRLRKSETEIEDIISKLSHWLEQTDINAISTEHHSDTAADVSDHQERETETEKEGDVAAFAPIRPRSKKKAGMPEDFGISARVQAWADESGFDRLAEHLDAFRRKAAAKGYAYVDWDAAFMEAIREDWAKLRGRAFNGVAPPANVQPIRGRDPALQKLDDDARNTKPPSLETLARLAAIRQGVSA